MNPDVLTVEELARYLRRDAREIQRLADRGYLPGRKVAGQWRFARAEILHWVETQLPSWDEQQLAQLEDRREAEEERLVGHLLPEACVAVPLQARTKASVLSELVQLAERSWQVYDPEAILKAVEAREAMQPTSMPGGVALPHPRRPLPEALGESVIAFGRTLTPIPFGGDRGGLCDLFFLVCCRDDRTHLRVLARLARMFLKPGFLEQLRQADSPEAALQVIAEAEQSLRK
ncbi:MAG: PTS sugar transporter subunit IIA [Gemmatales bacterium]|nr:PTS sugar transporter subunit IIA [Gemmatales bacterium]MDW7995409.1 PTS sugar transporter subunit IIA [Gemmatales bacterium]